MKAWSEMMDGHQSFKADLTLALFLELVLYSSFSAQLEASTLEGLEVSYALVSTALALVSGYSLPAGEKYKNLYRPCMTRL